MGFCDRFCATMCDCFDLLNPSLICINIYRPICFIPAGSSDPDIPSWGWWVGSTGINHRYWGGTTPGSGMCACGIRNQCRTNRPPGSIGENRCNCDAGLAQDDVFDDGYLGYKEHLPVNELRFGDTGVIGDQKFGEHTLGPLRCRGDGKYDRVIIIIRCFAFYFVSSDSFLVTLETSVCTCI